jgi:hypothetical protein
MLKEIRGRRLKNKMNENLFGVMAVVTIAAVSLNCKATNQQPKPDVLETKPHQIQNQTPATNPTQTIPIHLSIGSFDPLSEKSPTIISQELIIPKYEGNENGYYIIQFKGPVLQQWKDEVMKAGVSFFDYIPQFAFLIRMNSQSFKTVRKMDAVRWVGIYQPAYRISPDLIATLTENDSRPIDIIMTVFKGEDISALSMKVGQLGGEIMQISDLKEKLSLRMPLNKIPSLSRLTGIKYIEKVPEFKLFPNIKKKGGDE